MKKLFLLILIVIGSMSRAADTPQLILLKPTGNEIDGLTEMEIYSETSDISVKMNEIVSNSVIREFLELHEILQVYLYKTTGKEIEPAYLALTENQGGFAKKGFVISKGSDTIPKPESYYVDINKNTLDRPYAGLMSVTQLYPHELGHILYRLLSFSEGIEESSMNVNIHFFSLVTDTQIAFNEGFAEHLENIARFYETNPDILAGINADTVRIAQSSKRAIAGFRKDFRNPLRMGFYRMSMLVWYQPFEDYKRYAYALDARTRYANASIATMNRQNNLIYRNSGVAFDPNQKRNKPQMMASEGTVSTFFTMLSRTEIKDFYLDNDFYRPFVIEDSLKLDPEVRFTPLQNLFIKYFHVLNKYVVFQQTDTAQLIDFIEGYIIEFPEESEIIKNTFKTATGLEYDHRLPPELWMLVKDKSHGILAMDAYASLSVPFYTFNLNTAELEDVMMIDDLSKEDAMALLNHRSATFFNDLNEINNVKGISDEGRLQLLGAAFDEDYLKDFEFTEELSIASVIKGPVKNLILYTVLYFIAMMIIYFKFIRKSAISIKKKTILIIKYFLLWTIFVLAGLIVATTGLPILTIVALAILFGLFALLYKDQRRKHSMIMNAMMLIIILISVI